MLLICTALHSTWYFKRNNRLCADWAEKDMAKLYQGKPLWALQIPQAAAWSSVLAPQLRSQSANRKAMAFDTAVHTGQGRSMLALATKCCWLLNAHRAHTDYCWYISKFQNNQQKNLSPEVVSIASISPASASSTHLRLANSILPTMLFAERNGIFFGTKLQCWSCHLVQSISSWSPAHQRVLPSDRTHC